MIRFLHTFDTKARESESAINCWPGRRGLTFNRAQYWRSVARAHRVSVGRLETAAGRARLGPLANQERVLLVEQREHWMNTVNNILRLGRNLGRG